MTALEQAVREVLGQHCGCCQGQGGCTPCTPQARDLAERIAWSNHAAVRETITQVEHGIVPHLVAKKAIDDRALAAFTAPRGGDQ